MSKPTLTTDTSPDGALIYRVAGPHGAVTYNATKDAIRVHRNDGKYGGEGSHLRQAACRKAFNIRDDAAIYTTLEDEYSETLPPPPTEGTLTPADFTLWADNDGEQFLDCPLTDCHWSEPVAGPTLGLALRIAGRHIEQQHRDGGVRP